MQLNEYFYNIAKIAKQSADERDLDNIHDKWIYSQFYFETNGFTHPVLLANHNLGGLCQARENDTPSIHANLYYMKFTSFENFGAYFGHYLAYFKDDNIDTAASLYDYIYALKSGEYFSIPFSEYYMKCKEILDNTEFS